METFDDVVIGAGILGLAHAYHLATAGRRVVVLERSSYAQGASVRNFGMVWPLGQPRGERLDTALRSRGHWIATHQAAGLWFDPCGSIHAAYHDDELQLLREFVEGAVGAGYEVRLLDAHEARDLSPRLRAEGLRGAMFSATEVCVDPRRSVAGVAAWLESCCGVQFRFGTTVTAATTGRVTTPAGDLACDRVWVCTGDDLNGIAARALEGSGLVRCKLQMMRTSALPHCERVGPMLPAGLTLRHYTSFGACPSLPALAAALDARNPGYAARGIHVMVSQHESGMLTIGDSHEYGEGIGPFDSTETDAMILRYLDGWFDRAGTQVVERWHGVYAKHPTDGWVVVDADERVCVVTGVGGAGMTLSFGLAETTTADARS